MNVNWAATGATLSAAAVPTDASGISAVNVTLGATAGPITITATADGLTGSPLTFNATASAQVPVPTTAAVSVGDIFFASDHNGSSNPAVDTVAVNGTVTWTWASHGSLAAQRRILRLAELHQQHNPDRGNGKTYSLRSRLRAPTNTTARSMAPR